MRKLIAGFAISLDGFIEGPNGEIDWIIFDKEQQKLLAEFWKNTDTMLYGRKTYEASKGMYEKSKNNPFKHMKHYVFSKTLSSVDKGFILVNGDTEKEIQRIKNEAGKDIVVFGGAEFVSALFKVGLIDRVVLATMPVVLGKGKLFFQ